MGGYVQRYPFAPKAEWWKRYTNNASIGKRIIYKATDEVGFEIDGIPQAFQKRTLVKGVYKSNDQVEYIDLTGKAIRLVGVIYQYDSETQTMQPQDIGDEELEVQGAQIGNIIRFGDDNFIRQFKFDCIKDGYQQNTMEQPLNGLITDMGYLTLKTHNFSQYKDKPKNGDILFYQGSFWRVEETQNQYMYTPRERLILFITISKIEGNIEDE